MMTQIDQFSATVSYGDATSNQILSLQRILQQMGYRSEIFCERVAPDFRGVAHHITQYGRYSCPNSMLLLHFALSYSRPVMRWLQSLSVHKVLVYHNITPHSYFGGVNFKFAQAARAGRAQLRDLVSLVEAGWGVSSYNCRELAAYGCVNLGVLPIVFDPARYAAFPDRATLKRYQDDRLNILFVGRVAPNKRFEDLLATFYYVKNRVCADARLLLVGSANGLSKYKTFLLELVDRLSLSDVVFAGHVSDARLFAYYRCADVYLSMSEHEGFGVPFVESMYFGVPIVAYDAAAVSETLGGSGILIKAKRHAAVAELIGLLGERPVWRESIVARQRERLQAFTCAQIEARLQELLRPFG